MPTVRSLTCFCKTHQRKKLSTCSLFLLAKDVTKMQGTFTSKTAWKIRSFWPSENSVRGEFVLKFPQFSIYFTLILSAGPALFSRWKPHSTFGFFLVFSFETELIRNTTFRIWAKFKANICLNSRIFIFAHFTFTKNCGKIVNYQLEVAQLLSDD